MLSGGFEAETANYMPPTHLSVESISQEPKFLSEAVIETRLEHLAF